MSRLTSPVRDPELPATDTSGDSLGRLIAATGAWAHDGNDLNFLKPLQRGTGSDLARLVRCAEGRWIEIDRHPKGPPGPAADVSAAAWLAVTQAWTIVSVGDPGGAAIRQPAHPPWLAFAGVRADTSAPGALGVDLWWGSDRRPSASATRALAIAAVGLRARSAAAALEHRTDALIRAAVHAMRSPMMALAMSAEVLHGARGLSAADAEMLEIVGASVERLNVLLQELRTERDPAAFR